MRYHVRIYTPTRKRVLFTAAAPMDEHLTTLIHGARKYHNSLNADIDAGKWERTLAALGIEADVQVVEAKI